MAFKELKKIAGRPASTETTVHCGVIQTTIMSHLIPKDWEFVKIYIDEETRRILIKKSNSSMDYTISVHGGRSGFRIKKGLTTWLKSGDTPNNETIKNDSITFCF